MTDDEADPVHLFWTGGWDSTFRLLELLLTQQRVVQTYYVIDPGRRSTPQELEAMEKIQASIREVSPEAHRRLRPPIHIPLSEIATDEEITAVVNCDITFRSSRGSVTLCSATIASM